MTRKIAGTPYTQLFDGSLLCADGLFWVRVYCVGVLDRYGMCDLVSRPRRSAKMSAKLIRYVDEDTKGKTL